MNHLSYSFVLFAVACQSTSDDSAGDTSPAAAGPLSGVTLVAQGGFTAPTDAVASPDGTEFYFAARDEAGHGALFVVDSEPDSTAAALTTDTSLVAPTGLVASCDGDTVYVADGAALYAVDVATGALAPVPMQGVGMLEGLAMEPDCSTLAMTGEDGQGAPALFSLAVTGGTATTVYAGSPFTAVSGVHVDSSFVAWVMDRASSGTGSLFAVPADGSAATQVLSGFTPGSPGGVSLISVGGTAVIPNFAADGSVQLTTVEIATGAMTQVAAPGMVAPGGLRTARSAPVMVVVDAGGDAIYRAD